MKKCFKCGEEKELSEFYKHSQMADGHLNKCKACAKSDVSAHRHGDGREKVLKYDRDRYQNDLARRNVSNARARQWAKDNPKRRKAQYALGNAVRDGRVIPLHCFVCGNDAEAHHPDYDRPFDVMWLCPGHNKQAHALVKN